MVIDTELWDDEELQIFSKYKYRCSWCEIRMSEVLHELDPKSKNKNWKAEGNRVPLCAKCHTMAHKVGTPTFRKMFKEKYDVSE